MRTESWIKNTSDIALARVIACGILCMAAVAVWAQDAEGASAPDGPPNAMFNAVVKFEVVSSKANPSLPWQNVDHGSDSSGVVIDNGRILTCAHCVTAATFIRIRKHSEESFYRGMVEFIDNDSDLALVKIADPAFMRDITPMKLGTTPVEQAHVLAVGYPLGGEGVSFTEGVVSRIEDVRYTHSLQRLLAIQVDAAINPGNSGGPVFDTETGNICGIAFQGNKSGEALGYLIPPDIIRHFLRDIEDGTVNGYCDQLFRTEHLESEAARKYYGMSADQTGIRVAHVDRGLGTNSVAIGDIILEIDGYRVANNGNIRIQGNRRRTWSFPFTMRQLGDSIDVKVLRAGKVVQVRVPIMKQKACVRRFLYGRQPDYFIFGGFAFSTMSFDLVREFDGSFHTDIFREQSFEGEEAVAIVNVLPDDCIEGYLGVTERLVLSFNGEKVKNLRHLVNLVENCHAQFIRLGLDDGNEWEFPVVVETKKMREATAGILRTYQIPCDRSADLRTKP